MGLKPNLKPFNYEDSHRACRDWLSGEFSQSNCLQLYSKKRTGCGCMRFLANPTVPGVLDAVAAYMIHWASLPRETKYEVLHEWMKVADFIETTFPDTESRSQGYRLPTSGLARAAGTVEHSICRNGLCALLMVGREMLNTAKKDPSERTHGLKFKTGADSSRGKEMEETNDSLHTYFKELEEEGLPFATRIIRDETGTTTRDDNVDAIMLPPHITKRGCYEKWCFSRGWKVTKKSTAKTIYDTTQDYIERPVEPVDGEGISLWPPGSESKRVVSWPKFFQFWKKEFPLLLIRKKGADTCTDCLILNNEFALHAARKKRKAAEQENDSDRDISDDESERGDDDIDRDEGELERSLSDYEKTLIAAKAHVKSYQVQREESKRIISLARLDITTNNLHSLFRRRVLTIDMGQNLNVPNFEGEQPGDTYYMSPLTVLLFGVVQNATEDGGPDTMNAYTWQEFEGDRGQNNITSCLLQDLKNRGLLSRPNYGNLTYVADNCGGQNKNKVVVRFLMWLVESGFFPEVKIVFLVKGHTKNAADRLFNLLKLSYHRKNIYTYDDLCTNLDANEFVTVHKMRQKNFHNHLEWQTEMYRPPEGGEFKQSHVFTIRKHGTRALTTLIKQDCNDSIQRYDSLLPKKANKAKVYPKEERARRIKNMEADLNELVPSGLRPIKQVELYTKWAKLLPKWAAAITCPKPSQEVIDSIKKSRREKTKQRTADKNKRRKTETETADNNSEKNKTTLINS